MNVATRTAVLLSICLSAGCGNSESVSWLEGSSYRWDLLNHRVSHLHFAATDSGPTTMVVGGTSTTALGTELDPSCDSDTCSEFPLNDEAHVTMDVVTLQTKRERVGRGSGDLVVGAEGGSVEVTVDFASRAKGDAVAVLSGFTLDTNEALSGGEACYQPRNGWLPRRMQIALGDPVLSDDGRSATVEVQASFEAGLTFETERQCLDAVIDQAQVSLQVGVVVLAGVSAESHSVEQAVTYPYGEGNDPLEQPDPDPEERSFDVGEADAMGWKSLDYRFHQEPGDERGGYIRTLSFLATPEGFVSGHSNNYSPPTQLSGFDYAFSGEALAIELSGEVSRESLSELIEIELDDEGTPIPQSL